MRRYSEAVRELYEVTGPCHGGPVPCPPNLTTALRRGVPYVADGPLRATAWIDLRASTAAQRSLQSTE